MTDNVLIEEAKHLIEQAGSFREQAGDAASPTSMVGLWLRTADTLAAVLAVFEKAHTPSDNEREAMRRIIAQGSYSMTPESLPYEDVAYRLVEAGFGFRRSEVPEPSARCPKCGVTVTEQTPSTFYPHHDETCGGPLEEPQGEPSDAMIDAALKAWGHYKWVGLPTSNQVAMRAALRAALRAAGGVR